MPAIVHFKKTTSLRLSIFHKKSLREKFTKAYFLFYSYSVTVPTATNIKAIVVLYPTYLLLPAQQLKYLILRLV